MFQEPIFIQDDQLSMSLDYPGLIHALAQGFNQGITVPTRHHYEMHQGYASTLLLMPAWFNGTIGGVKMVTIFPHNHQKGLPSIQGIYTVFNAQDGRILAQMDAKKLTNLRTAATSALATRFLARENAQTLLMMGTGTLAPELVKAHCTVRPIRQIFVWGRNPEHQEALVFKLSQELASRVQVHGVRDIKQAAFEADLITCATMSDQPILEGKWVKSGTHVDLVGSYKPHLREADDDLIRKASLFVDTVEGASQESGDLAIPLAAGVIELTDLKGTIFGLCRGEHKARQNDQEITVFKSVGHAAEDLIAAQLLMTKLSII